MAIMDEVMCNPDPKIRKDKAKIAEYSAKAFVLEKEAAQEIPLDKKYEPTRSVLYRSAGWLAMDAGDPKSALEMAEEGLKGAIHGDMVVELEELKREAKKLLKA